MTIKGFSSTDSDECILLLVAKNIHQMSQEDAARTLAHAFDHKVYGLQEMSDRLGVVMWLLRQELTVEAPYLNQALIYARHLIDNDDYLNAFFPAINRYLMLVKEIARLQELVRCSGFYN